MPHDTFGCLVMTARPKRRGASRRGAVQHSGPAITTPPVGGRYEPLAPHECEALVEHAFEILGTVGMADAPTPLAEVLTAAGASRRSDGRLLLPRGLVEAALLRAPSIVELPGRDDDHGLTIGGPGPVHIGTGGAAVQRFDADTGTFRESSLADLHEMMQVLDACPNIHYGLRPLVARDVAPELLDLHTAFALATETRKPTGLSFVGADNVDPVIDLFDMALGAPGAFARRPHAMAVVVHVVPPLRFAPEGYEIMVRAIERGMVIQTCSAGQSGATSPASLAGSLAQGLAEILAGVVMADAIAPGHPCIHAFMPFVSDLRTGAMIGGGGEAAVSSAAAAQLLRHLGLPHAVSAGITDSKVPDAQAGYEKGYTVALAAQAGAEMVQLSVGMLGSIMVASPEALVIDDDMCGAILRSVRGIEISPGVLDLAITEAVVGGDGHYLGHAQTLELMRSEYVYPSLGDRTSVDEWIGAGRPSLLDRASRRVTEILERERDPIVDDDTTAAIRARFGLDAASKAVKR